MEGFKMCSPNESGKNFGKQVNGKPRKMAMTAELADNIARCLLIAFEDDDPTLHRDSREALKEMGQTDEAIDAFLTTARRYQRRYRDLNQPAYLN